MALIRMQISEDYKHPFIVLELEFRANSLSVCIRRIEALRRKAVVD